MNRLLHYISVLGFLISCKSEHPDLKTAFEIFTDAQKIKQTLLTTSADLNNQAKIVDGRIRNENPEDVFSITEVYNHLETAEKALTAVLAEEKAVPGHEKESPGIRVAEANLTPAQVLMHQKTYRDNLLGIKNDLDAASTLLNQLKTKVK